MSDDALQVDLDDIVCNSTVDGDGIEWTVRIIDDLPEMRGGTLGPTGRHGTSVLARFRGGRIVAPDGAVVAPTQALAFEARERLAALGFGAEFDITWHETIPKFLTVTQNGPAKVGDPIGGLFEYQLDLIAAFPFRKAVTAKTGSLPATLTNDGTLPAYPVFTTTGSGAVDIVIDGRHFTTTTVPSGTVIDMWARTITDGSGNDVTPWPKESSTEWLALPPGPSSVTGSGVSYSFHDTYA